MQNLHLYLLPQVPYFQPLISVFAHMRGIHQTKLNFIQKKHEVRGLCIKTFMWENFIMSCRRWVVSASGLKCSLKRNWKFLPHLYFSAHPGEHRRKEKSSSIFKIPSWILRKRQFEDKSSSNDLVMMLCWWWNELRFVGNGWFSSHYITWAKLFEQLAADFQDYA